MTDLLKINAESRLYVLSAGGGVSCLGFDYADNRARAVAAWLGVAPPTEAPGTEAHYAAYASLMSAGAARNARDGSRCPAELSPSLVGLEGRRVEVTTPEGERRRFKVGRSTGWLPCHLELAPRAIGGEPAHIPEGATVRPL